MRQRLILALWLPLANAFNVSRPAFYCNAGNTVTGDSNLGAVTLNGVQGKSIADTTNCPGTVGLRDLTALTAAIQPGGSSTLTFMATTCDTGWQRLAYAFIDYNGNGNYETPGELLGTLQVDNRLEPFAVNFAIHAPCVGSGSVVGNTRMRVFVVESGVVANPCLTFAYGGVKEFTIEIISQAGALCGGSDLTDGGGGGTIFLVTLLVVVVLYFAFAAVWVFKLHPEHADKIWFAPLKLQFYKDGFGLVKDGCIFTKNKTMALVDRARGRKAGFESI